MNWTDISWSEIIRMKCSHIIDHCHMTLNHPLRYDDTTTCNTTSQSVLALCYTDGYVGERPILKRNMYTVNGDGSSVRWNICAMEKSIFNDEMRELYCRVMRYHLALLEDGCFALTMFGILHETTFKVKETHLLIHSLVAEMIHDRDITYVDVIGKEANNLYDMMLQNIAKGTKY